MAIIERNIALEGCLQVELGAVDIGPQQKLQRAPTSQRWNGMSAHGYDLLPDWIITVLQEAIR